MNMKGALEELVEEIVEDRKVSSTSLIVGKMLTRNRRNYRKRWNASQAQDRCFVIAAIPGPEASRHILSSLAVVQWIQSLLIADCFVLYDSIMVNTNESRGSQCSKQEHMNATKL